MRSVHVTSALVLILLLASLCATAADNSPRTISDLPPAAQAKIQAALQRNMRRVPMRLRQYEVVPAPTEGPWAQLAQPVPSADQNGGFFGMSVAVSGSVVVVGQPYNFSGNFVGEAFVFVKPATGDWNNLTQSAVLIASDGLSTDFFASSVAISGNTIVVGSPPNPDYKGSPGRSYIYVKPAGGWSGQLTQTAELTASDGANGAAIGTSVSISGDTAVVGAPGETPGGAYVYVMPTSGWVNMTQTAKLTASDGIPSNQFGNSVSISGGTIVAGAPGANGANTQAGAAYVFTEPAGGWGNMTQTAKLIASDGASFDQLGLAAAVSGSTLVAGATAAMGRIAHTGAAYVYSQPAGGWKNATETAKLIAPDGQSDDLFGSAVAISNSTAVVGAPQRSPGPLDSRGYPAWWLAGGAYVFAESGSTWTQTSVQVLNGSDAHNDDLLGSSVSIDGNLVATGAPKSGKYSGAAFLFVKP
jgi:hypothetical protein